MRIAVAWAAGMAVAAAAAWAAPPYAQRYVEIGRRLVEAGDHRGALAWLERAVDLSETAERRYLLGRCHEGLGDPAEALFQYQRAFDLKEDPATARAILRVQKVLEPLRAPPSETTGPPEGVETPDSGDGHAPAFVAKSPLDWLAHPDPTIRSSTARAFGRTVNRDAVPGLVKLLADREAMVRSSAAEALGRIGDPTVASDLVAALDREDMPTVQLGLLSAVTAMPPSRETREAVARLIARRPATVVEERSREVLDILAAKEGGPDR